MNKKLIKQKLCEYGIDKTDEIKIIRDKPGINIIIKCICPDKNYIMKIYRDGWSTAEKLNNEGMLNNYFVDNGMPFARILKINGQYCSNIIIDGINYNVSLEECINGIYPEKISSRMSEQMAELLAKEHMLSERSNLHFGYPSCWSVIYGNTVTNDKIPENLEFFLKFIEKSKEYKYDSDLINNIEKLYYEKKNLLSKVWDELPCGPVQGDWGEYNMVVDNDDKILGIFDFNIAGDEVYVNEFASIVSWNVDDEHMFIEKYTSIRPFNELEKEVYPIIMQIVKPFKFYKVNNIIKLMEEDNRIEAMELIEETLMLLNKEYSLS